MKFFFILICLTLLNFSNVSAVTLNDALNQAYQNNIQLNACLLYTSPSPRD